MDTRMLYNCKRKVVALLFALEGNEYMKACIFVLLMMLHFAVTRECMGGNIL